MDSFLVYLAIIRAAVWLWLSVVTIILTVLIYTQRPRDDGDAYHVLCSVFFSFGIVMAAMAVQLVLDMVYHGNTWLFRNIMFTVVGIITIYSIYRTIKWLND